MTDSIPLVSQIKSLLQLLFGQTSQALETQFNFIDATPILSQLKSLYELFIEHSPIQAYKTQRDFLIITNATVENIPLIGHVKGLGHYLIGDTKQGHKAMKRASRTTVVIISGYFACICFVPPTATLSATITSSSIGSIIGGLSIDTLMTMIENIMDKDGSFNGHYQSFHEMAEDPKDVGKIFDFLVGPLLDGLVGAVVGYKMYHIRNAPIPPLPITNNIVTIDTLPPPPKIPLSSISSMKPPSIPLPAPFNPWDVKQTRLAMKYGSAAAVVERHAKYKKQNLIERLIDVID